MNERLATFLLVAAVAVAGCGGGGSSTGGGGGGIPGGGATPTPAPGNLPLSEAVGASPAWVNPSSHRTLYFLDVDTPTGATCTAGCLSIWPVFAPAAGSQNTDNMTLITRSDGTGQQWAYQNQPLYMYAGDTGPDQSNGDGIPDFGGHWHVARPASSSATPPPGDPACHGYC